MNTTIQSLFDLTNFLHSVFANRRAATELLDLPSHHSNYTKVMLYSGNQGVAIIKYSELLSFIVELKNLSVAFLIKVTSLGIREE